MSDNPWLCLPRRPPFVLPSDTPSVDMFNRANGGNRGRKIQTALLPEPFIGRIDAPVVILALNPGYSTRDHRVHAQPRFRNELLRCIGGDPGEIPFYHLNPSLPGPGRDWWRRALKPLLLEFDEATVSRRLLCLEYFPYHSIQFAHAHLRLPSQEFTFGLLRSAIRRSAVIIVTRGLACWAGAVPELMSHSKLFRTKTQRVARISPGNCPEGFKAVCAVFANLS